MGRPKKVQTTTIKSPGLRAIIYIRVSTQKQAKEDKYGIDNQHNECLAYCLSRGYEVISTVQDALTGITPIAGRPGLSTAMEACESDRADVIVAYKVDQFSRQTNVFYDIRKRAQVGKYRLETSTEGTNLAADGNEFMGDIYAAVAAEDKRNLLARLNGTRKARSKVDGRGSGSLPWGYRVVPTVEGGKVVTHVEVNQDAAKTIYRLLYLRELHTYALTASMLNQEGHRTAGGSEWTISHVQKIERHRELYTTGKREHYGETSQALWPIIYETSVWSLPAFKNTNI